jgi:hypothetical protein
MQCGLLCRIEHCYAGATTSLAVCQQQRLLTLACTH